MRNNPLIRTPGEVTSVLTTILIAMALGTLTYPSWRWPSEPIDCDQCVRVLEGYSISASQKHIEVILVTDRAVAPKAFTLRQPPRLILDLEPAWISGQLRFHSTKHPMLKGPIRTSFHLKSKKLRIVLDLLPGIDYDVAQDLFMGDGRLGVGGRFVLTVRKR